MIVESIERWKAGQATLPPAIDRALKKATALELATMEPGRYELEGDKLFALIQDVESRSFEESRTEAHSKFADVQIPLSASERYGFSLPQAVLALIEDRMEANDIAFYERPSREFFMDIDPGAYVVFLPNELHRPCLTITEKTPIRKAVIKVHRDLLGL